MAKGTQLSSLVLKLIKKTYIQTKTYRSLQKKIFLYIESHTILNYENDPWIVLHVSCDYVVSIVVSAVVHYVFKRLGPSVSAVGFFPSFKNLTRNEFCKYSVLTSACIAVSSIMTDCCLFSPLFIFSLSKCTLWQNIFQGLNVSLRESLSGYFS